LDGKKREEEGGKKRGSASALDVTIRKKGQLGKNSIRPHKKKVPI